MSPSPTPPVAVRAPVHGVPVRAVDARRGTSRRLLLPIVVAALGLVAAPTTAAAVAPVAARPVVSGAQQPPSLNRQIVQAARARIGDRYRYGAAGPRAFDCSGLVYFLYRQHGVRVPRTAAAQFRAAHRVSRARARPGDLIFYHSGSAVFHVAVFVGDGRQIAAATPSDGVVRQHIWSRSVSFGSFTH